MTNVHAKQAIPFLVVFTQRRLAEAEAPNKFLRIMKIIVVILVAMRKTP
jgi:hypothetical protein